MGRTLKEIGTEPPSQLVGTLAIAGFAAEVNLRNVAEALGKNDLAMLATAPERNAKLARLRIEIDQQVAADIAKVTVGTREVKKLRLTAEIACMFEEMGSHTVPLAQLSSEVLRHAKPSRLTEIKKLIEHAVFIADKAVMAFIDEDLSWAQTAVEQSRAATDLYNRIKEDLATLATSSPEALDRVELLNQIADQTHNIIRLVSGMACEVVAFLEAVEI